MNTAAAPLDGLSVFVPRPADRSVELTSVLEGLGARVRSEPAIRIITAPEGGVLDTAVARAARGHFDWVVFTSVNTVDVVVERARTLRLASPVGSLTRVAVVGPATARAVVAAGMSVARQPVTGGSAADLAATFPPAEGDRAVWLPQSALAAPTLARALTEKGYQVRTDIAYRTAPAVLPREVRDELAAGTFTAVLFTSPSTVASVLAGPVAPQVLLGAIGPTTAHALQTADRPPAFIAATPTAGALAAALITAVVPHPTAESSLS